MAAIRVGVIGTGHFGRFHALKLAHRGYVLVNAAGTDAPGTVEELDVEGWEVRALHGARRALASGRVEAGFIEVSPETLRRAGAEAGELLDLLQHFGFDAYFAGLWDEGSSGPSWACVSVNGTAMRFSPAAPLPADFVQGDVLVVHRTTALAPIIRSAVRK